MPVSMHDAKNSRDLVQRLAGHRILVVGDLMLDEYLVGQATRLSREAPVPVLEQTHSFSVLGGACNPAHNIVALGSQAVLAGVVGDDASGQALLAGLQGAGIDGSGVCLDQTRPTTTKMRLVAESALRVPQQLARIDRLSRVPLPSSVETLLLERLEALAPSCSVILVSHYQNGVVTPAVADRVRRLARQHGALTVVDGQADLQRFAGFDLIKCNRAEAEAELGMGLVADADFERALTRLVPQLGVSAMAITRGADGMSVLWQGGMAAHIAAIKVSTIYDVVGAGDTVVAVLSLALAAGITLPVAAHLANAAAGLVVRKLGNAVVRSEELAAALSVSW